MAGYMIVSLGAEFEWQLNLCGSVDAQLGKVIDQEVGAGGLELVPRGIAVRDAASLDAGVAPHEDIHRHVAHHQGMRRVDTRLAERPEHGLGVGLGMLHAVGTEHVRDAVPQPHCVDKGLQRPRAPRRGNGQHHAPLPQLPECRQDVGEGGRHERLLVAEEDLAVRLHKAVGEVGRAVGVEMPAGVIELQADGAGAGRLVGHGQIELMHGGLQGADNVVTRVGQCAVKIEDDQLDGHGSYRIVELYTIEDGAAERHLVGVLQFVADGDAARDDRHTDGIGRELAVDEEVRRVALHRRAERQHHLAHLALRHTLHQTVDLQIGRTDAVDRRDDAAEDMIEATKLRRILDRHHVLHVLHHADRRAVARRIGADVAEVRVADVVARPAILHVATQGLKRRAESLGVLRLAAEQVKRKPQRRLPTYAGQRRQLVDGVLKERGGIGAIHDFSSRPAYMRS